MKSSRSNLAIGRSAYDVPDVMSILGVSRQSVYNAINRGELRSFKIGRRRKITPDAIKDYIASRERRSTNATN